MTAVVIGSDLPLVHSSRVIVKIIKRLLPGSNHHSSVRLREGASKVTSDLREGFA